MKKLEIARADLEEALAKLESINETLSGIEITETHRIVGVIAEMQEQLITAKLRAMDVLHSERSLQAKGA